MCNIHSMNKGMPWPKTGATNYHVQVGLPDKGSADALRVTIRFHAPEK